MLVYVAVVKVQTAVGCSVLVHNFLDRRRRQNNITFFELIGWTLRFNFSTQGFPVDDLRKIFIERPQVAKVPNGVETLPKNFNRLSRAHRARTLHTTHRR